MKLENGTERTGIWKCGERIKWVDEDNNKDEQNYEGLVD